MKKNIPLKLLQELQTTIEGKEQLITVEKGENSKVIIRDSDLNSNFFFCLSKNTANNRGQYPYLVTIQPSGKHTIDKSSTYKQLNDIIKLFQDWFEIIEEYHNTKTVFDDPVLLGYQKDFYKDYIILDKDAEQKAFEIEKQLILDRYLEWSIQKLEEYKNEQNTSRIQIIQDETQDLRKKISRLTKASVMKRLSRIWAKCTKEGLDIIKQVYLGGKKKFIQFVLDGGTDILSGFLN